MGIGKNSNARRAESAAEKGMRRHRRDNAREAKLQRDRDERFNKCIGAANALRGARFNAEFTASVAHAVMSPGEKDAEMAHSDAAPSKLHDKKQAKANRLRFKTFPNIVTIAFPDGFADDYRAPGRVKFSPLWDPEVVASLKVALDFGCSMPKNGVRLQTYILNLFEAAVQVKRENPALFPAGQLVIAADQKTFLDLVGTKMSPHLHSGGLPTFRYGLSNFALGRVIDGMAAARKAYRDASPKAKAKGSHKELYVIRLVDRWIESFGGGQFLLQELVVKSRGLMTAVFRPMPKNE